MKRILSGVAAGLIVMIACGVSPAQTAPAQPTSPAVAASSEDGKSPESLLVAIYAAISGPAGERDWAHFRNLFLPDALFTRTAANPEGKIVLTSENVDGFVKTAGDYFMKQPFYETQITGQIQRYGRMVQAFSSYESRHAPAEKPFSRGINSVQMINDGKRWWVVSIAWDSERTDNPLPKEFAGN
jgi:hypothetical protein